MSGIKLNAHLLGKYALQHVFLIVAPTVMALFYNVEAIRSIAIDFSKAINLHDRVQPLEIPIIISFGIVIPAIISIYNYYKQVRGDTSRKELATLLSSLGGVVDEKLNRYYEFTPNEKETILEHIRPDLQKVQLKKAIASYFRSIYDDKNIICDFFTFKDGLLSYDRIGPDTVDINVIRREGSTAQTACLTKKMQVIPDTSRKGIPFIPDPALDIKSIICYPIVEKGKTQYVISVSSKKVSFSSDDYDKYEMILSEFASRIKLELYLQTILELERGRI